VAALDPAAFWEFSLAYYASEPVASACLSLQDRRGADVNILLCCCWLATIGYRVDRPPLEAAIGAGTEWRRVVLEPLRAARRSAWRDFPELTKSARDAVKQGILAAELEAERVAQGMIATAIEPDVSADAEMAPRARASTMLEAYLGIIIPEPDARDAEDLAALLEPL